MSRYEVIIDRSSTIIEVLAESEDEASKIAWDKFMNSDELQSNYDNWVAEINKEFNDVRQ